MAKRVIKLDTSDMPGYEEFRDRFLEHVRRTNKSALAGAWDAGELYGEYVAEANYGDGVVTRLSEDMVKEGMSSSVSAARSAIYAAIRINNTFGRAKLMEYADNGMATTHANILASVDDDLRKDVLEHCFEDRPNGGSRIVSCSRLRDLIEDRAKELGIEVTGRVVKTISKIVDRDELPDEMVEAPSAGDPVIPAPAPSSGTAPTKEAPVEQPAAGEFKGGDEQGTAGSGPTASDAIPGVSEPLKHPLKELKRMAKILEDLIVATPTAVRALDQMGKDGFDSDTALENARKASESLSVALSDTPKCLKQLASKMKEHSFEQPGG